MRAASTVQDGEPSLMKQTYMLSLVIGVSLGLGACASRTDTAASQPASTPTSTASTSTPGSTTDTARSTTTDTSRTSTDTPRSTASTSSTAGQADRDRKTESSTQSNQASQ